MSLETQHLLRVLAGPEILARDFAAYCKHHQVITRGLCKIGYVTRQPPPEALPKSQAGYVPSMEASQLRLRGLIANKDIKKDENVVMMAERACVHPGRALRCEPFMKLLPDPLKEEQFCHARLLMNDRLSDGSLIRYHQLLLALYMTYMVMAHRLRPEWAPSAIPGADVIQYLDFLPRAEGDFRALSLHLSRWLDAAAVVRDCQAALSQQFQITQAEVRSLLLYCLAMLFSRVVPVDHKGLLSAAFKGTPQEEYVGTLQPPVALPSGEAASSSSRSNPSATVSGEFVAEPISFLCPIIDMCNHGTSENVAVMVPSSASSDGSGGATARSGVGPVICLRTLRDVRKGEELTMCYSHAENELKVVWGMTHILQ
eukprot:gene6536-4712_t